eukprot:8903245-Heterocapsa_arctica.AAC.1
MDGARSAAYFCILTVEGAYPLIAVNNEDLTELLSRSIYAPDSPPRWAIILNTHGCVAAPTSYAAHEAAGCR